MKLPLNNDERPASGMTAERGCQRAWRIDTGLSDFGRAMMAAPKGGYFVSDKDKTTPNQSAANAIIAGNAIVAFGLTYVNGRYRARTCDPQRVMLVR